MILLKALSEGLSTRAIDKEGDKAQKNTEANNFIYFLGTYSLPSVRTSYMDNPSLCTLRRQTTLEVSRQSHNTSVKDRTEILMSTNNPFDLCEIKSSEKSEE